jgi:hypothetical protein
MADIVFPPTLPVAGQRPNYSEQAPEIAIRTPMDLGPDKVRLGAPAGIRTQSVTLLLTAAEKATFDTFYRETIRDGALPFEFTHQRTLETIDVRIKGKPKSGEVAPNIFLVSFEIEHADPLHVPATTPLLTKGLGFGSASDLITQGL